MEIVKDFSCGLIPLRKEGEEWKVFLINQIPRQGNLFWTFPKGHPEQNETHKETALRELQEETGIIPDSFFTEKTFCQRYTFMHEGQHIEKEVIYYLGVVSSEEYTVQAGEVKEAGWFTFSEAQQQVTHDIARTLLREVHEYVTK